MASQTKCRTHPTTQGLISLLYCSCVPKILRPLLTVHNGNQILAQWNPLKTGIKCWRPFSLLPQCGFHFKIMSRWYSTLARIADYLPTYYASCFWGRPDQGYMKHIWWMCPKVKCLRIRVYSMVITIFHSNLNLHKTYNPWEAWLHKQIEGQKERTHSTYPHFYGHKTDNRKGMENTSPLFRLSEAAHSQQLVNEKYMAILVDMHTFLKTCQPWLDQFSTMRPPTGFLDL